MTGTWMFLGVRVDVLSDPDAPVVVAEGVAPRGASPPLHVHADLDDSFYLLDGRMVVRCGDDVFLATSGTWVQFPKGVPHTFRVLDRPARVLMVHANDSFIDAVRAIGHPAAAGDVPTAAGGPPIDELNRALAAHGITSVGPPMEQDEAEDLLRSLV
jgi:mannose-6-phosphate isomerase-like protein (cupin superfamily)